METNSIKIYLDESNSDYLLLYESGITKPEECPLEVSNISKYIVSNPKKANEGSITFFPNSDRSIQLKENIRYKWKLFLERGNYELASIDSSLQNLNKINFEVNQFKDSISGGFKVVNFIGSGYIRIISYEIIFDIVPVKFNFSEYKLLTEEISSFCEQLLLEWSSPTTHTFITNPDEEKKIVLEQFLFLKSRLSQEKLEYYSEMILRNPHRALESEWEYNDSSFGASADFFAEPIRYGKNWYRVENNNSENVLGFLPEKILSQRKYDSYDTAPNRFLKFALEYFLNICNYVEEKKPSPTSVSESRMIKDSVEYLLSAQMFSDVGSLDYIPFNNQTLLKREGYRQILEVYNLVENAISLSWDGNREAFEGNNRGVDVLYEYWVYIKVFEILKQCKLEYINQEKSANQFIQISKDKMQVNLKEGKETISVFIDRVRNLRIHFYYNRSFQSYNQVSVAENAYKPLKGSYSRTFRPDYTIVILPFSEELDSQKLEEKAVQAGNIAYLHFDAKYRLDRLEELFQVNGSATTENEESLLEEKRLEKSSIYKSADLYKMHAYNEAIRKSVGSYIIYPGNRKYDYSKYYEILPGVGAFPMSPSRDSLEIKEFIEKVFTHQSNQFTQLYRISFFTHDTVSKKPMETLRHSYIQYPDNETLPPEDLFTLIGFVRKEEIELVKDKQIFFFHAIRNGEVVEQKKEIFQCSFFIGYSNVRETLPWYAKIKSIRLCKKEELEKYRSPEIESTKGVSHYYLVELDKPLEISSIKTIDDLKPGIPIVKKWSELI